MYLGHCRKGQQMYLSPKASPEQLRQAQQAQRNRQDIIKALSHGQISRRDVFKWGLFTAGGGLAL
ncbi:MAG: copper oxidase, partial [Polaromonas sp.]|nr:copper oxidase [Polaromonas sp.]